MFALRGDLLVADEIDYFIYALTLGLGVAVSIAFARREAGLLRLRWWLFASSMLVFSLHFLIGCISELAGNFQEYAAFLEALTSAISSALLLLAASLFFSHSSKPMVAFDMLMASLFCILRFAVIFAPGEKDFFAANHLQMSVALHFLYFVTSMTAYLGAASRSEARFLRLMTIYCALQFVGVFMANTVSYVWLHYERASIWDTPEIFFNMAFALVAVRSYNRADLNLPDVRPSSFVRNLLPSFLTLGNIALGLCIVGPYPRAGVLAILFAVLCFALRTALLQGHVARERDLLREANRRLEQLVTSDPLTGTGNRRSLASALEELSREEDSQFLSLILVDADHFKRANDFHGHQYGDQVLVAISNVLLSVLEGVPDGHCARLGGDEFALLLPNCDIEATLTFAENIRRRVKDLAMKAGDETISISLGATVSPSAAKLPFESLMSRADEALYRAKTLGRDRAELLA